MGWGGSAYFSNDPNIGIRQMGMGHLIPQSVGQMFQDPRKTAEVERQRKLKSVGDVSRNSLPLAIAGVTPGVMGPPSSLANPKTPAPKPPAPKPSDALAPKTSPVAPPEPTVPAPSTTLAPTAPSRAQAVTSQPADPMAEFAWMDEFDKKLAGMSAYKDAMDFSNEMAKKYGTDSKEWDYMRGRLARKVNELRPAMEAAQNAVEERRKQKVSEMLGAISLASAGKAAATGLAPPHTESMYSPVRGQGERAIDLPVTLQNLLRMINQSSGDEYLKEKQARMMAPFVVSDEDRARAEGSLEPEYVAYLGEPFDRFWRVSPDYKNPIPPSMRYDQGKSFIGAPGSESNNIIDAYLSPILEKMAGNASGIGKSLGRAFSERFSPSYKPSEILPSSKFY